MSRYGDRPRVVEPTPEPCVHAEDVKANGAAGASTGIFPATRQPSTSPSNAGDAPLVSVVTPAYNEEKYIAECIESVLRQSYSNWEYLIINNCSTDHTGEIAREYAKKDARIRVHDNDTLLPVVANHNFAMRSISPNSKYCKVVFADDFIHPECIEKMVALAETDSRIAMVGAYRMIGGRLFAGGVPYPQTVMEGRQICRAELLGTVVYPFGTSNTLLYRSALLRRREKVFNEKILHADTELCYELLKDNAFGFVHEILSFERIREGSTTSVANNYETHIPTQLKWIKEFGPVFLENGETDRRYRDTLAYYYHVLGRSVYRRRDRKFWAFHQEQLAHLGLRLSKARVAVNAAAYGIESVVRRLRQRL